MVTVQPTTVLLNYVVLLKTGNIQEAKVQTLRVSFELRDFIKTICLRKISEEKSFECE